MEGVLTHAYACQLTLISKVLEELNNNDNDNDGDDNNNSDESGVFL
jgi:hypothetical protein